MAVEALVPYRYPVSLDGAAYMVDTAMGDQWRHETIPLLRPQADDSATPSVESLNPEGEWRKPFVSFHKGAGQNHRDRPDSNPFRFRASYGVDVWTPYELKVLPSVASRGDATKLCVVGNRLFRVNGAAVSYTEDVTVSPTWTDCTNEPGTTILDIASNGEYVWITDGSNSYWADASASPPAFNLAGWTGTQDADVLGFVKGRLMSGHENTIHTYDAAGAATPVTLSGTLPATWTWVGFAGGPTTSVIYAAGFVGDKSIIYRIGLKEDGTGLDAAIVAGELPDGEVVRAIDSYLGVVLLGTDNGVRFAQPDASGNLTIGALLETGTPVRCFEGQDAFVWFGWEDYTYPDGSGTRQSGLGRLSLEEFSSAEKLAPAYATDLMTTAHHSSVTSVVTFQGIRVHCGNGTIYAEVATGNIGQLQTGWSDLGFTGPKIPVAIDVDVNSDTAGRHLLRFRTGEDDTFTLVATSSYTTGAQTVSHALTPTPSPTFELDIALQEQTAVVPQYLLRSLSLRAIPGVSTPRMFQVPLKLVETDSPDGGVTFRDVETDLAAIATLRSTREPVTYIELGSTYTVTVEDYTWVPRLRGDETDGWGVDGTCLVKLKELAA